MEPSDSIPFDDAKDNRPSSVSEQDAVEASALEAPLSDDGQEGLDPFAFDEATSQPFIGRWNHLVSRTNWEKGRIILDWRDSLSDANAPATAYSDEAWSRLVGGVTSQHVGRLRRVYRRFGDSYQTYEGLYWTHFQAAADWDDAEMWLEGAVRESWSVSKMRRQRWETLGSLADEKPEEKDIVAAELDEDFEPALLEQPEGDAREFDPSSEGPRPDGPDFGDEEHLAEPIDATDGAAIYASDVDESSIEFVRPFQNLNDLPGDFAEAFEGYKLAIIRHKSEGWSEISAEDVLASLDALKALVIALVVKADFTGGGPAKLLASHGETRIGRAQYRVPYRGPNETEEAAFVASRMPGRMAAVSNRLSW